MLSLSGFHPYEVTAYAEYICFTPGSRIYLDYDHPADFSLPLFEIIDP